MLRMSLATASFFIGFSSAVVMANNALGDAARWTGPKISGLASVGHQRWLPQLTSCDKTDDYGVTFGLLYAGVE